MAGMTFRALCVTAGLYAALLSGCGQEPPPPPEHPALQYRFKKTMQGMRFSPDGARLLHSLEDATGMSLISVSLADGSSELLANFGPGELRNFSYFRSRPMVLWAAGPTNREMTHHFTRAADGTVTDLTPGDNVNTAFYGWSDDGASFYYGSNRADRRYLYLHSMDASTLKFDVALPTQDTHLVVAAPNRRFIALIKQSPGLGAEMFTYDFESRKLNRLSPPGAGHLEVAQFFTPDSGALVYLSDADSGLLHVRRRVLGENEAEELFPEATSNNVLYARRSLRGKYLVLGVAEGATPKPLVLDGADGSPIAMQGFDGVDWDILDISADERLMAYTKAGATPGNLYVYSFETGEHQTLRP
jgi:hypothetical protein